MIFMSFEQGSIYQHALMVKLQTHIYWIQWGRCLCLWFDWCWSKVVIPLMAGWARRGLRADCGRVQRRPLHPWRLNVLQQWNEVHHQVRCETYCWHKLTCFLTTRDRDQDKWGTNCAQRETGGGWYKNCSDAHLTGLHTERKTTVGTNKQIWYYQGGERGRTTASWKEAEMVLIPN